MYKTLENADCIKIPELNEKVEFMYKVLENADCNRIPELEIKIPELEEKIKNQEEVIKELLNKFENDKGKVISYLWDSTIFEKKLEWNSSFFDKIEESYRSTISRYPYAIRSIVVDELVVLVSTDVILYKAPPPPLL
jgi:hypothetical protein